MLQDLSRSGFLHVHPRISNELRVWLASEMESRLELVPVRSRGWTGRNLRSNAAGRSGSDARKPQTTGRELAEPIPSPEGGKVLSELRTILEDGFNADVNNSNVLRNLLWPINKAEHNSLDPSAPSGHLRRHIRLNKLAWCWRSSWGIGTWYARRVFEPWQRRKKISPTVDWLSLTTTLVESAVQLTRNP